ncbi:MAG: DUF1254 domain-containing protein, partial [Caulobacteraceae bacterium]
MGSSAGGAMDRRRFVLSGAALASVARPAFANVDDLRGAAREAWLYGVPLIQMAALRAAAIGPKPVRGTPGFGAFAHARHPAGPADRLLGAPETDVLYSSAWIDLGGGEGRIRVPPPGGRYFCLTVFDMYGNVLSAFDSAQVGRHGHEVTVRGPASRVGVDGYTAPVPRMPVLLGRVVHAPNSWVFALARVHLAGESDLAAAHALQDGFEVRVKETRPAPVQPAPLGAPWNDYFLSVQRLIEENPPPETDRAFFRRVAPLQLGMRGGFEHARFADADLAAITEGVKEARARAASFRGPDAVGGWIDPDPDLGDFGDDYVARAQWAMAEPAAPPTSVALSLRAAAPDGGALFTGDRYRLVLPGPPPADGFWSLTLYEAGPDGQLFLADNPLGRYAIDAATPGLV